VGSGTLLMQPWAPTACDTPRMFFNRPDFDLATAAAGTFALVPHDGMRANLEQDYRAMSQMIFGEIPAFDGILESIVQLEQLLNG
jgi:hypothetical protein